MEVEKETRTSSDPKTKIRKLFSSLRSTTLSPQPEPTSATKPRTWRDLTKKAGSPAREAVVKALKELGAWSVLHQFCTDLPVFQALDGDKGFLSGCVGDGGSGHTLETLLERYVLCICSSETFMGEKGILAVASPIPI